jgi:hypothetical protein
MKTMATSRPVLQLNHHSNSLSLWPTLSTQRGQQPMLFRSSKGDVVVEIIDFKDVGIIYEIMLTSAAVYHKHPQTAKRSFLNEPNKQFKSPDNGSQTTSTAGLVFV